MDRFVPCDGGGGGWIASCLAMTGRGWIAIFSVIASEARQSMGRFVPRDDGVNRECGCLCSTVQEKAVAQITL